MGTLYELKIDSGPRVWWAGNNNNNKEATDIKPKLDLIGLLTRHANASPRIKQKNTRNRLFWTIESPRQ